MNSKFQIGWKEYKIGEIVSLEYGKALQDYQHEEGPYNVFGTNGKIGTSDEYIYDKPSVIIGRKGAYREVHFSKDPFYVIDTAFYTKNKIEDLDTSFLYYWFKNVDINEMDSGSAIPSTSRDEVYDLTITLPQLPEQKRIATALRGLDNKIDLLRRQNNTLESMAETMFRQLKQSGAPFDEYVLNDLFDIRIGRTPPREQKQWFTKNNDGVKWISIKDLGAAGIFIGATAENLTHEAVKKFNIPIIPAETVVLSFKLTIGRVGIPLEDMVSNEAIAHFIGIHKDTPPPAYLYLFLKTFNYGSLGSTSSIAEAINSQTIREMTIRIPDAGLLEDFQNIANPLFQKIRQNTKHISSLIKLRDTLLPKLLSGDARVKLD